MLPLLIQTRSECVSTDKSVEKHFFPSSRSVMLRNLNFSTTSVGYDN
jgi:hypothetical protein